MRILLMAGGGGTRLWPLSTEARPKQFLPLLSTKSLLRETFERLAPAFRDLWVATSARHAELVARELSEVPAGRIFTEPVRRNSGPAILASALRFAKDGDPVTAAVPTDQNVRDADAFCRALAEAGRRADGASVVILAVPPTRPESDFGYVEVHGEDGNVLSFVEKPDADRARALASSGRHLWNAGLFVFRPSRLLAEARRVAGDLVAGVERYVESGSAADYERLPDISFDFAVMEKASGVAAVPLEAGWSDVGTWRQVRDLRGAGPDGNLVIAENGRAVLAPGVRDSAIVSGPAGILVLPFDREGELKPAVERLRSSSPSEEEAGSRNR
jgi:mannose-1-phosphate guanylyltransferase